MYAYVAQLTKRYGDRMFADDDGPKRFAKNVAYVGTITTHYRTQHANFDRSTPWPFPCTAGETIAVIDYNGDVRACELREKFGTLADHDYDFGALWAAEGRQTELNAIDGEWLMLTITITAFEIRLPTIGTQPATKVSAIMDLVSGRCTPTAGSAIAR